MPRKTPRQKSPARAEPNPKRPKPSQTITVDRNMLSELVAAQVKEALSQQSTAPPVSTDSTSVHETPSTSQEPNLQDAIKVALAAKDVTAAQNERQFHKVWELNEEKDNHPFVPKDEKSAAFIDSIEKNDGSLSETETQWKLFQTAAAYLTFMPMGMCVAVLGATLLDLQQITSANESTIVTLFTWRGIGSIIGNVICGTLFSKLLPEFLFALACFTLVVSMIMTPLCSNFIFMASAFFIGGIAIGTLGAGLNTYILMLWHEKSPTYLQGLHFFVSFGATLGPLICSPFVQENTQEERNLEFRTPNQTVNLTSQQDESKQTYQDRNYGNGVQEKLLYDTSHDFQTNSGGTKQDYEVQPSIFNETSTSHSNILFTDSTPSIIIPYIIISVFCLFSFTLFFTISILHISNRKEDKTKLEKVRYSYTQTVIPKFHTAIVITALSLLSMSFGGLEATFGGYITTFGHQYLHLSKFTSTLLATTFWGAYATGRALGIVVIKFVKSKYILIIDCLSAITAFILFHTFCSIDSSLVFILCVILGLSFSTAFANILSYAQTHFFMSPKIASTCTTSLYVGMMLWPSVIGSEIVGIDQMYMVYSLLMLSVLALGLFIFLHVFITKYVVKYHEDYINKEPELIIVKPDN